MEQLVNSLVSGQDSLVSLGVMLGVLFYFLDRTRTERAAHIILQVMFINFLVQNLSLAGLDTTLGVVVWAPLFVGTFLGFYLFIPRILRARSDSFAVDVPAEWFTTVLVCSYASLAAVLWGVSYLCPAYEVYAWVGIAAGKNLIAGLYAGRFLHYAGAIAAAPRTVSLVWAGALAFYSFMMDFGITVWLAWRAKESSMLLGAAPFFLVWLASAILAYLVPYYRVKDVRAESWGVAVEPRALLLLPGVVGLVAIRIAAYCIMSSSLVPQYWFLHAPALVLNGLLFGWFVRLGRAFVCRKG